MRAVSPKKVDPLPQIKATAYLLASFLHQLSVARLLPHAHLGAGVCFVLNHPALSLQFVSFEKTPGYTVGF